MRPQSDSLAQVGITDSDFHYLCLHGLALLQLQGEEAPWQAMRTCKDLSAHLAASCSAIPAQETRLSCCCRIYTTQAGARGLSVQLPQQVGSWAEPKCHRAPSTQPLASARTISPKDVPKSCRSGGAACEAACGCGCCWRHAWPRRPWPRLVSGSGVNNHKGLDGAVAVGALHPIKASQTRCFRPLPTQSRPLQLRLHPHLRSPTRRPASTRSRVATL